MNKTANSKKSGAKKSGAKKSSAKTNSAKVKDLKPKKNPKGGGVLMGLLLPAATPKPRGS